MHQEFLLLNFLLSYLLHSGVLLACAMLAHKMGWLKHRSLAESIWRLALFGAILTAGLQVAWTSKQITHEYPLSMATTSVEVNPTSPPIEDMQSDRAMNLPETQLPVAAALNDTPTDSTIRLPVSFKFYAEALTLAWGVFAVFVFASISLSMFYLNSKIALMPELDDDGLLQFAATRLPAGRQIHIHHGDAWSSPLLCPNGRIFLPNWALEELDHSQCKAMLAHEIAHLLRHDRYWRIAHQIMLRLFFFQVFNRYAIKQLELLAEFDCDQAALEHSNAESFTQTLMHCAQMHINNHPTFALPMAKPSSLLQRINIILSETNHGNKTSKHKQLKTQTVLASIALLSLCYAMPTIAYTWEEIQLETASPETRTTVTNQALPTPSAKESPLPSPVDSDASQPITHIADPVVQQNFVPTTTIPEAHSTPAKSSTSTVEEFGKTESIIDDENQLNIAKMAIAQKDFARALPIVRSLAQTGNTEAQAILGEMLWYGDGSNSEPLTAQHWLKLAANKNHARAQQFIVLFTERERRQKEINYYTHEFDGGTLKWTEKTCPQVEMDLKNITRDYVKSITQKLNARIDCHNNFVAKLKDPLIQQELLPEDMRRIMRADEITLALQRQKAALYQSALQSQQAANQQVKEFEAWDDRVVRTVDWQDSYARKAKDFDRRFFTAYHEQKIMPDVILPPRSQSSTSAPGTNGK